ncbi:MULTISPECIES: carboxylating nicotinate-nucleotide diphosphorylase [Clostridium]|uniref:carboxylating nicotinate-nucleotide diphosphorylase n=1 Tax=Clostridium TaxID=1485 RepID=UPI0004D62D89|nr:MULTISPECIES: carboxylating nicotinate-nucleotide diphosphorylase [Clostridium]KEH87494.1 nicotinate-nucleotide pyrophosphorylase [Clostridium novyi A str. 4540]KEH91060.1 nicotinate-nucleotide pyrophosphorylase [Clostridium novyi A str. BKT29909]KEH93759.1 nicotinate-nucleotide pyrophosphorylase [Clostridium botulinum C/D str. It1]KEH95301.1 nicotinate-nucleotide pyrophosphorylase [Clostridium novyi A str. GD211209]
MNWFIIDKFLIEALKEDNFYGDITTEAIVGKSSIASVDLIAKEEGIIAGLNVFERVFTLLGNVEVKALVKDGDEVSSSQLIAKIKGNTRSILTGERVALNMLQKISGIATITNKFVKEIKGTKAKLLDTRKTTPNLRVFEKYAVKVGGGYNHRFSLSDGVLIKDNHIDAAGGIKKAIELVRNSVSFVRKIEVEVENLTGVQKALESKADIIMLDNMDIDAMKKAVKMINGKAIVEASGNVNLKTIRDIANTGVDYISCGIITHSAKALDISMKNLVLLMDK